MSHIRHIRPIPAPLERPTDDDAARGILIGLGIAMVVWTLFAGIGAVLVWGA